MSTLPRILIVEDDEHLGRGLEINLRKEGYEVSRARKGETALAMAARLAPDLITLDVMLPDMTGLDVCRELRHRGITAPIIMLTARSQELDKVLGLEIGAPPRNLALSPLAFPTILAPHGIAVLVLLLAASHDSNREAVIILLFFVVMAANWVVMRFARSILQHAGVVLAVLGAVLGVLQVALAVQIMLNALRELQVLPVL
jgi:CheY-like chemotaxis protein